MPRRGIASRVIAYAAGAALLVIAAGPAQPAAAHIGETADEVGGLTTRNFAEDLQLAAAAEPPLKAVPRAECGPGAREETGIQGRVSRADHESGLAAQGLQCNAELVGSHTQEIVEGRPIVGSVGGYKVLRYVDDYGNECAYYDTSLLPPANAPDGNLGVRVLDMNDPEDPALSTILATPAMSFPHESLILSEKRGLLMAVAGNLSQAVLPGIVDIYDLNATPELGCKAPVLMSSTPLGIFGHESGLSPDGNTFYSASFSTETVIALDISIPAVPIPLGNVPINSHGLSISEDGTRAYVAKNSPYVGSGTNGLGIMDISDFQNRKPNPEAHEIASLQWTGGSIPQNTVPITVDGKPYVIESDEFGPGAARIIDISDEENPFVLSNMRLEVHQDEIRSADPTIEDDPGVNTPFAFAQDYTGHFCNVPTRVDPKIVACGMSVSGLRVFNIEDLENPREVAYFTAPVQERVFPEGSNWAYSNVAFAPERKEIWYSEAYTGFYAVKLTNGAWPDDEPDAPGNPDDPGGPPEKPGDPGPGDPPDEPVDAPDPPVDDAPDPQQPGAKCAQREARVLNGTSVAEVLFGTRDVDVISGRGGADKIGAGPGDDCVRGGPGDDELHGDPGADRVRGGSGADVIRGGIGDDRLNGSAGDDEIHGARGDDVIRGGRGSDLLDGGAGSNRFVCGSGKDTVIATRHDRIHKSCEKVRRVADISSD